LSKIGLQPEDTILAINNVNYNLDTVYEMMTSVEEWKEGQTITIKIKRNGKEQTISGAVQITFNETESYKVTNPAKQTLNTAWLKG
jgi:PDZ domain-containing secreted protein